MNNVHTFRKQQNAKFALGIVVSCFLLISCGEKSAVVTVENQKSSGQVVVKSETKVTRYAAARFADQVSFGATPALVAEIEQKGFEKWIDDQFLLPVSKIDASSYRIYNHDNRTQELSLIEFSQNQFVKNMLSNPDQLRSRVNWSIFQFVPVLVHQYGSMQYVNLLQEQAFGNYCDFIKVVTKSPAMGEFLNNVQNRPKSAECPWCTPNENYARELMQLFTLGVVELNQDGSTVRNQNNQPVETYTQEDVEELAAALTGWSRKHSPQYDFSFFEGELFPDQWPPAHDRTEKKILGKIIPAGKEAPEELDLITNILMGHKNIAPFVSLRLIQHLVTSDPSPAYIARISAVFRDNGKGVKGDLKAVVKAILLDSEARAGDYLGSDNSKFGKIREPVLWYTAYLRGLGCKSMAYGGGDGVALPNGQEPYNPPNVFSFYSPTDRAPGSNLLAPEQKLLNSEIFNNRLGGFGFSVLEKNKEKGCDFDQFGRALAESPIKFVSLVSERYFRGAMPPTLRQNLIELAPQIWGRHINEKADTLILYALFTPYFGVIK